MASVETSPLQGLPVLVVGLLALALLPPRVASAGSDVPFGPSQYVRTTDVLDVFAVVEVVDVPALDRQIQARWQRMKDTLRRGDVDSALEAIALASRADYGQLFTNLTVPLGKADGILTDLVLEAVHENRATYKMLRVDNEAVVSHFVLFVRDLDGIWRLELLRSRWRCRG